MAVDFLQNTLDGLSAGAAYALLALGFTLIFGVLRRANLSFGPAIMFGCYAATWTHVNFRAGPLLLALITVAGAVLAGAYVERLCFAPHRGGSAIAAMVASFALWMQFEELATLVMPRHLYAFPLLVEDDPLALGLLEAHSQWYLGPQLRDLIAYLLLFVLLAARVPWMHTRSAS